MDVKVIGIDTSNLDIVNAYVNTTMNAYPMYSNVQINIVDASTLEILLS